MRCRSGTSCLGSYLRSCDHAIFRSAGAEGGDGKQNHQCRNLPKEKVNVGNGVPQAQTWRSIRSARKDNWEATSRMARKVNVGNNVPQPMGILPFGGSVASCKLFP